MTYAMHRQFKPRILNICSEATSVARPCRTRSTHGATPPLRAVNGAASDASPGRTVNASLPPALRSSAASIRAVSSAMTSPGWEDEPAYSFSFVSPFSYVFFAVARPLEDEPADETPPSRSATPTCAAFSAPTSLVPSPHIIVRRPAARIEFTIFSF